MRCGDRRVAEKPSTNWFFPQPLTPGMGLKWLRDWKDSANVVAAYSVNGQPNNWNFFANSLTNHIDTATTFKGKLLEKKFSEATL